MGTVCGPVETYTSMHDSFSVPTIVSLFRHWMYRQQRQISSWLLLFLPELSHYVRVKIQIYVLFVFGLICILMGPNYICVICTYLRMLVSNMISFGDNVRVIQQ